MRALGGAASFKSVLFRNRWRRTRGLLGPPNDGGRLPAHGFVLPFTNLAAILLLLSLLLLHIVGGGDRISAQRDAFLGLHAHYSVLAIKGLLLLVSASFIACALEAQPLISRSVHLLSPLEALKLDVMASVVCGVG